MFFLFFFNDTATTEIYTLSLHDALPISVCSNELTSRCLAVHFQPAAYGRLEVQDRKSTRLNSSHSQISYAVFCLKKKKPRLLQSVLTNRTTFPLVSPRPAQSTMR